jgi:hypothetical protein
MVTTLLTISINVWSKLTQLKLIPIPLPSMFIKPSTRNRRTTTSYALSLSGWMLTQPDGSKFCACIFEMTEDHDYKLENNKNRIKFLLSNNEDTIEEIITYNQLLDYLAKDDNNDIIWNFKLVASHQSPLIPKYHNYKGSTYNIMAEWENGETTM